MPNARESVHCDDQMCMQAPVHELPHAAHRTRQALICCNIKLQCRL
jgi:hypothetical protein